MAVFIKIQYRNMLNSQPLPICSALCSRSERKRRKNALFSAVAGGGFYIFWICCDFSDTHEQVRADFMQVSNRLRQSAGTDVFPASSPSRPGGTPPGLFSVCHPLVRVGFDSWPSRSEVDDG